jgi:hypothetical protein
MEAFGILELLPIVQCEVAIRGAAWNRHDINFISSRYVLGGKSVHNHAWQSAALLFVLFTVHQFSE